MIEPAAVKKPEKARLAVNIHPAANAVVGAIGAGVGAAAATALLPLVGAAAIVGGAAGYFLTNRIPHD
jgi:hypothetical protein